MSVLSQLTLTQGVYAVAALMCAVFISALHFQYSQPRLLGKSVYTATLTNIVWLVSVIVLDPFAHNETLAIGQKKLSAHSMLLFMETLHYCVWALALTKTAQKIRPDLIPRKLRLLTYCVGLLLPPTSLALMSLNVIQNKSFEVLVWHGVIFSVLNLLILEKLYRSCFNDRIIRVFCTALGLIFLSDVAFFSQYLANLTDDLIVWQIRACVVIAGFVMMTAALFLFDHETIKNTKVTFSQPAIIYSVSLSSVGLILVALAIAGYYIQLKSANWVLLAFASLCICLVSLLTLVITSSRFRQNLNIFINQHLFNYKYDYRSEWLKLIRDLAQTVPEEEVTKHSIRAVATLFRCNGAAILLEQGKHFVIAEQFGEVTKQSEITVSTSSALAEKLGTDFVFAPNSPDDQAKLEQSYLPAWTQAIPECWMIAPLLIEEKMMGILILSQPIDGKHPNWEDFDLIKTVGRQVANYLTRHFQSEMLAEARQFETFNKLSAFLMHDLKNLIAQQSLVVKNAEKHKDNPAFVEDAINTINNSVERMNNLLTKLQQTEPETISVISVKSLLLDAAKRCQKRLPVPTLADIDTKIKVKADHDSLMMVFIHIIQNAQDATANNGFIDIYADIDTSSIKIIIEDNGEGMTEHFIRKKLFRPFESTKLGKGMGVGVYQAREYLQSIGGDIRVESEVDAGTKFSLILPIAEA